MLDKKTLSKIKRYFRKQKDVVAVYLYGSQVRGEANQKSDIDLAVLFDEKKKLPDSWGGRHVNIASQLEKLLNKEVEVQDLSLVDISFAHRVLTEGGLLCSKDESQRVDFETHSLNQYFDLKPFYDEYYQVLEEKARRGLIGQTTF